MAKLITGIVTWVFITKLIEQRQKLLTVARAAYRALEEEKVAMALEKEQAAKGAGGRKPENRKPELEIQP